MPLLAGASFTLVALVLQSTTPFGRWQDLTLLLVGAGLAQVFAAQSVIWTRRYMVTPDELNNGSLMTSLELSSESGDLIREGSAATLREAWTAARRRLQADHGAVIQQLRAR